MNRVTVEAFKVSHHPDLLPVSGWLWDSEVMLQELFPVADFLLGGGARIRVKKRNRFTSHWSHSLFKGEVKAKVRILSPIGEVFGLNPKSVQICE